MTESRELFVEEKIIAAVKGLLTGRVNDLLGELQFSVPEVEFGSYAAGNVVVPVVSLNLCERTEKERLILLDAYSLTITFALPETPESELRCYAYATAVEKVLLENSTLDSVVDRIVLTGKKHNPPKTPHCGEGWELAMTFRLTVEEMKV
jgi:hypothetical protein